jgi:hypothetical protein
VIQTRGGCGFFSNDPAEGPRFGDLSEVLGSFHFMVFSAAAKPGRKTATHEHLSALGPTPELRRGSKLMNELSDCVSTLRSSMVSGDSRSAGASLTEYADHLAEAGLEIPEARKDREALSRVPGVFGVKGAGALLSDAVIALIDSRAQKRLAAEAERLGLRVVCERVGHEPGVRRDD